MRNLHGPLYIISCCRYGRVAKVAQPLVDSGATPRNKTRLVAWFVSNCNAHSGRDEVVKGLSNFIKVIMIK